MFMRVQWEKYMCNFRMKHFLKKCFNELTNTIHIATLNDLFMNQTELVMKLNSITKDIGLKFQVVLQLITQLQKT